MIQICNIEINNGTICEVVKCCHLCYYLMIDFYKSSVKQLAGTQKYYWNRESCLHYNYLVR